jgi:cysteine desulfurase/selenocysteine lyase
MTAELGDRSLFPRLAARAYLAHAAISPLSSRVQRALAAVIDGAEREGLGAMGFQLEQADRARELFAGLIGAEPEQVARLSSTSAGVSAISTALRLEPGDRIIVFEGEFPTNVTPWAASVRRAGAELVFCPLEPFAESHAAGLAAFDALIDERVRLVAVSAVEFQTGLAMPLGPLAARAHAHGARLFVDAIQAVGAVPIDVRALGVDYLAAGGHKWLMGPMGAAFLYVAPDARAELEPIQVGWTGTVDPFVFLHEPEQLRYDRPLYPDARAFEQGVLPFLGFAGAAAAMQLIAGLGVPAIHAHIQTWHDAIEPGLIDRGWRSLRSREAAGRSGILALRPPEGLALSEVVTGLGERGVVVTGPDGCLRLAPHWPNSTAEVPLVLESLDRVSGQRASARN